MDSFTRDNLRELRPKLEAALKAFGDENGIVLSFGSISFSGNECHTKLKMATMGEATDADEAIEVMEKTKFERYAKMFGLEPEHFGKEIRVRNELFTISGIAPNRPKFPINATRADGKRFKLGLDTVKIGLGLPASFMSR
jgi:hypothetical protein